MKRQQGKNAKGFELMKGLSISSIDSEGNNKLEYLEYY